MKLCLLEEENGKLLKRQMRLAGENSSILMKQVVLCAEIERLSCGEGKSGGVSREFSRFKGTGNSREFSRDSRDSGEVSRDQKSSSIF